MRILGRALLLAGTAGMSLGVGTSAPAVAQQGGSFDAELEISRSASVVVLEYHRDIGMLAEPDPTPFLRIHGDGRYLVHYPVYMKKAGDWEGRISLPELDQLVRSAIEGGLLELDARVLRSQIRAAEAAAKKAALGAGRAARLFEVSDLESTRVRLRLERYKPAGVLGAAGQPVDQEIVWWGLRHDARRHPQIRTLQELAALEARLRALAEAPGLKAVVGEEGA